MKGSPGRARMTGHLGLVHGATRPSPLRRSLRYYHGPAVARIRQPTYSYPVAGHSRRITSVFYMGPLGLCPGRTPRTGTG
ncbi:hypothetical protein DPMN_084809 [Dreissena polymorpha]|uniref:Uncharacterized protein n=1 Tax=Dreissena polymorpha TaxID=45954 RepID=A0A9D4BCB7_DREPO|nr:hypothetical protein DPMN_084809 [Dreissena polymorpha]